MNVLHHLALQSEVLVILLQETHCTDAEKLVLPNYQLAGSSLSRKHGLATFVHERLRYTLLDQSLPTSEIEWLCVDVNGYKIVNVYKPPPTRLRTLEIGGDRWSEAVRSIDFSHSSPKVWSTLNNITGRSRHSSCHCSISADAIASQLVRNGKYEVVDRKSSRLVIKKYLTF